MAAVILDIEEAFGTTWYSYLVYKLSELEFLTRLIELIASFLDERKFNLLIEGEFFARRKIAAGVPQGFVLAPIILRRCPHDT
jgi:hypothetical protein